MFIYIYNVYHYLCSQVLPSLLFVWFKHVQTMFSLLNPLHVVLFASEKPLIEPRNIVYRVPP